MATSKVEIVATFLNRLSAPVKKATKDLKKMERGTDRVGRMFKKETRAVKDSARASATLRRKLDSVGGSFKRLRNETRLTTKELALFGRMEDRAARRSFYNDRRKRVGGRMMKGGAVTSGAAGMALSRIATEAFDFSKGMNKAISKMPGIKKSSVDMLRNRALNLGSTTQFTATDVTGGMQELAAGLSGKDGIAAKTKQIYDMLPTVVYLAGATDYSMKESADILTNIANQFGRTDYSRVGDIIGTLTANANIDLGQFAQSMKYAGVVASKYGLSLEEVGGSLMTVAQTSLKADMAGTSMVRMLNVLVKPNKEAQKALKAVGFDWKEFFTADGKSIGVNAIVEKFRAMRDSGSVDPVQFLDTIKTVFRERGGLFIDAMLSRPAGELAQNTDLLLNKSGGNLKKQNDIMMRGLYGATKKMTSAISGLFLQMAGAPGEGGLTDTFISLAHGIRSVTTSIKESPLARFFANLLLGSVVVGALLIPIGAVAWALGALGITAAAVFSIPMAVIAAFSAASYIVYKNWDKIVRFAHHNWNIFSGAIHGDTRQIKEGFRGLFDSFVPQDIQTGWSIFFNWFKGELSSKIEGGFKIVKDGAKAVFDFFVPDVIQAKWSSFFGWFKDIFAALKPPEWFRKISAFFTGGANGSPKPTAATTIAKTASTTSVPSVGGQTVKQVATTSQRVAQRVAQTGYQHAVKIKQAVASTATDIETSGSTISGALRRAAIDIAASANELSKAAQRARVAPAGGNLSARVNNAFIDR